MAARVGIGSVNSDNGPITQLATNAFSVTAGNFLLTWCKWEAGTALAATPITNSGTALTWSTPTIVTHSGGGSEPKVAISYAMNTNTDAALDVVWHFAAATATFVRAGVDQFSGLATSSAADGSAVTNQGTGTTYTTSDITTTIAGLVVGVIGGYTSLSSLSGTAGNPDFTVGTSSTDAFLVYLLSGSAQTVTPGASASGSDRWVMAAQAFKNVSSGSSAALSGSAGTTGIGTQAPGTAVAL